MLWLIYGCAALVIILLIYPVLRFYEISAVICAMITGVAIIGGILLVKIYFSPHFLAWQYERHLKSYSLVVTAAEKTPQVLQEYLEKVKAIIRRNGKIDPEDEVFYAAQFVNELLVKYGPSASNDAVYAYMQANLDFDQSLLPIDPVLVLFHEFPEKFTPEAVEITAVNKNNFLQHLFTNAEKVVLSGLAKAQSEPTETEKQQAMTSFREVTADLTKNYPAKTVTQTLQQPEEMENEQQAANIVIAFYQKMIDKGQAAAAVFMRVTFLLNRTDTYFHKKQ